VLPLPSVLDVDGWLTPHPAILFPGMTQYQSYRRFGGPQGAENSPLLGCDPRTVQPVGTQSIGFEC